MSGYDRRSIPELEAREDRPARRFDVSSALGIEGYNLNVAFLDPGERLALSGLHYHEDQEEFFYVAAGRCRVELEEGSFDLETDGMVRFDPGTAQFVHNPSDEPAKVIAIGHPPDAHRPAHQVQSSEELFEERYGGEPCE